MTCPYVTCIAYCLHISEGPLKVFYSIQVHVIYRCKGVAGNNRTYKAKKNNASINCHTLGVILPVAGSNKV